MSSNKRRECLNPFGNQVSFDCRPAATFGEDAGAMSQSLRKSGQFRYAFAKVIDAAEGEGLNPFGNQVSFDRGLDFSQKIECMDCHFREPPPKKTEHPFHTPFPPNFRRYKLL